MVIVWFMKLPPFLKDRVDWATRNRFEFFPEFRILIHIWHLLHNTHSAKMNLRCDEQPPVLESEPDAKRPFLGGPIDQPIGPVEELYHWRVSNAHHDRF